MLEYSKDLPARSLNAVINVNCCPTYIGTGVLGCRNGDGIDIGNLRAAVWALVNAWGRMNVATFEFGMLVPLYCFEIHGSSSCVKRTGFDARRKQTLLPAMSAEC